MRNTLRKRSLYSCSDNRKSKICPESYRRIENRKLVGIFAIILTFVLGGAVARAQQTGKVPRIGFLDAGTAAGSAVLVEAFRQELSRLGWVEGKNMTIEYRFAEQKSQRQPELAADLVRFEADLIVVSGTTAALAAKRATPTIPIVMAIAGDPVGSGLIGSLARPGGNVTGELDVRHRADHQTTGST
jgi:putative ABC transport system substrate-binding protein